MRLSALVNSLWCPSKVSTVIIAFAGAVLCCAVLRQYCTVVYCMTSLIALVTNCGKIIPHHMCDSNAIWIMDTTQRKRLRPYACA